MNAFEKYLIAHLAGDYLLQNNWMALGKGSRSLPLVVHSCIYGLVFGLMFQNVMVASLIAIVHMILDKSYYKATLSEWWLRLIGGRSLKLVLNPPTSMLCSTDSKVIMLYTSFTALIYCIVDFLLHFIIQYPLLTLVSS
jgi:hypothetical protein